MKAIAVLLISLLLCAEVLAASVKLEVDPGTQVYDSIRIHMANIPRDFVYSEPPVYAGPGSAVTGSPTLKHVIIPGLTPGQTYKFIAVITKGTEHSAGSNIVQQKIPEIVIKLEAAKISIVEVKGE